MKTLKKLTTEILGLELVEETTVWDIHSVSLAQVADKKNSNIYKAIEQLKKNGVTGWITITIGAKGRSAHSATQVLIFKGMPTPDRSHRFCAQHYAEIKL